MPKRLNRSFDDFEETRRKPHSPEKKGREKQMIENYIHDWETFESWDDVPIETFQRFTKRGS